MTTLDDVAAAARAAADSYGQERYVQGGTDQAAADKTLIDSLNASVQKWQSDYNALQAEFDQYKRDNPAGGTPPPPPPPSPSGTIFSAYAGPDGTMAGQTPESRDRVSKALGVPVLPADRVYSGTGFGKAIQCPSKLVAVSYGQVKAMAAGDASVKASLVTELKALAAKTSQVFHVSCDHEVDSKIRKGTYTAADVKKAHAAFATLVRSIGAPNIKVAGCWTGYALTLAKTDASYPANYYDPASYDVIAIDAYYVTQKTAAAAFDPAWNWIKTLNKPMAIWEIGWSTDSNPQTVSDTVAASKVQEMIDYWNGKVGYVLFFESVKGDNLLELHTAPAGASALSKWAAKTQGK